MKLHPFAMERWQSIWENRVAWNLSESGVHPLSVEELAGSPEEHAALLAEPLGYGQTNGTPGLRAAIAAMYPGATAEHVLVTNGGSEANCVTLMHLVEPGDEVVMMMPNYMQAPGLAAGLGATLRPWWLAGGPGDGGRGHDGPWRADTDRLDALVTPRTKAIFICNPNNPTGARIPAGDLDRICGIAARAGAWVIADEIYRGAELDGEETPTVWGRYERTIVTSGLSKAYGLPGLRIGWAVAPPETAAALWGAHDYTSIAPGVLSDHLARLALQPARRELLLARTRGIVRANYPLVKRWIEKRHGRVTHAAPEAGAIVLLRYRHEINSTALVERLREERSVLVVPGDHFEMDGHLRIGFGSDPEYLGAALELVGEFLDALPDRASR
jgi:aspartate/methionine/tyrosine aminotransferase